MKVKLDNEKVWQRTGYRGIYYRLLKSEFFQISNKTKSQATLSSSFEEAVSLISLENSMS